MMKHQLYSNTNECVKYNRCKKYRICEKCNNIRQARLCDVAELASRFSNNAHYSVIMPHTDSINEHSIKSIKTKLARKLRANSDGLFTTIETSKNNALHINTLILGAAPNISQQIKKVIETEEVIADVFIEPIQMSEVRRVTAYTTKRKSLPCKAQYSGNLFNGSGSIKTAGQIMQSYRMLRHNPAVFLVSINKTLKEMGLKSMTATGIKNSFIDEKLNEFVHLVAQLGKQDICYSKEFGILDKEQFIKMHRGLKIRTKNTNK